MVHPYKALKQRQRTPRISSRPKEWQYRDAAQFLMSVEANTQSERRFAAQHSIVDLLEEGILDNADTAQAVRLLQEDFRDGRLGVTVKSRLEANDALRKQVLVR